MLLSVAGVPAFKNLLEYHSELFFAYQRMTIRAVLATSQVALKAAALALLLILGGRNCRMGRLAQHDLISAFTCFPPHRFTARSSGARIDERARGRNQ